MGFHDDYCWTKQTNKHYETRNFLSRSVVLTRFNIFCEEIKPFGFLSQSAGRFTYRSCVSVIFTADLSARMLRLQLRRYHKLFPMRVSRRSNYDDITAIVITTPLLSYLSLIRHFCVSWHRRSSLTSSLFLIFPDCVRILKQSSN